jgi:hypothetical protein
MDTKQIQAVAAEIYSVQSDELGLLAKTNS